MVRVYFGKIREEDVCRIKSAQRRQEIEKFSCREGRAERISVWLMLEYAVKDAFGFELNSLNPKKNANGKWVCDRVFFSLSHSHGGAAVSVSDEPTGVDIERMPIKNAGKLLRALTNSERVCFESSSDRDFAFASLWTKKECIFKKNGNGVFSPAHISANSEETCTRAVNIDGASFCLSVTGNDAEYIEL